MADGKLAKTHNTAWTLTTTCVGARCCWDGKEWWLETKDRIQGWHKVARVHSPQSCLLRVAQNESMATILHTIAQGFESP